MTVPMSQPDWPRARRLMRFAAFAGIVLLVVAVVYYALLMPILISAFITYLMLPLVERLERRRIPRAVAVPAIVVVFVGIFGVAVAQLAPVLYRQALLLIELMPRAMSTVTDTWLPLAETYVVDLGLLPPEEVHRYVSGASLLSRLESQLQAGLSSLWTTGTTLAGGIINVFLIPVLTFFFLKDYRRIRHGFRELTPPDLLGPTRRLLGRIDATLRTVLKGQATVAGVLAILYVIGLSIVGLKSALAIGVVAGLCRIIPYLDVIVGVILSTVVLLSDFQGWGQVIGVAIVFLVVQGIDGAFITPSILGERIGLHPMAVIVSVIAFAHWFGFWGVLLAVPVVAIAKVLYQTIRPYYLASRTYLAPDEPR